MQTQSHQDDPDLRDLIPRSEKARDYPTYRLDRCLWHDDKSPSLLIYRDGYQCQSAQCGAKGTIKHYLQSHGDAHVRLVQRPTSTNVPPSRRETRIVASDPIDLALVLALVNNHTNESLAWLDGRGITEDMAQRWMLGWDPFKREITIPIVENREIWNVRRRPIDPHEENRAKYRNWVEYKRDDKGNDIQISWGGARLYNADALAGHSSCIISEGEFDAILTTEKAKLPCVTSTSGCDSWQKSWSEKFRSVRTIYLVPDLDAAGLHGAIKSARALGTGRCRIVTLPKELGRKGDLSDYWKSFDRWDFLMRLTGAIPAECIDDRHGLWGRYE